MTALSTYFSRINRPSKIAQTIAERIRALIADGTLKPGDKLPSEKELCDAFGVSRSSVREALQSLEHLGLIESRPGVGRFLSQDADALQQTLTYGQMLERASVFELMEARWYLEVTVARLAAERATDDEIATLESHLNVMEEVLGKDMDRWFEAEQDFHVALSRACRNSVLTEMVNALMYRVAGQAERFLRTVPYTCKVTHGQFGRIVAALKEGDPEKAGQAMQEHLEFTKRVLNRDLSEIEP